jgi:glycosyltransferase involved in cell wall biosynthesis
MSKIKISVIVPVYNSSHYLRSCLDSILGQNFRDFECILIDDYSTDESPAICDEYKNNDERIIVVHKTQNEGASLARKTGIDIARGDFIQCIDSDDWIENSMLETMYQKAVNENLDIVVCDLIKETKVPTDAVYVKQEIVANNKQELIMDIIDSRHISCYVYNKLIKKDLFAKVIFPVGSFAEDRVIIPQVVFYLNSIKKIACINIAFYHYVYNENSSCNHPPNRITSARETFLNHVKIIEFLQEKYGENIILLEPKLSIFFNRSKHVMMVNSKTRNTKICTEYYPESNKYLFNKNFDLPFYHKLFLFLASKKIMFQYNLLDFFYLFRRTRA